VSVNTGILSTLDREQFIPVIVHGGGPQIGELLRRLGIQSTFVGGMRVTDDETMDVVEMVLAGKVRQEIVGLINSLGGSAVGLSGRDGGLITGRKITLKKNDTEGMPPEIIDLGRVGEVVSVNTGILSTLDREQFIPVIAPVGADESGETLNINADLVAGAVAGALRAKKLVLLTDVPGILRDGELISSMSVSEAKRYMKDGTIVGGMIPKTDCCLTALEAGVEKTHIIDGRDPHSVLLEIFTDGGVGTQIIPD